MTVVLPDSTAMVPRAGDGAAAARDWRRDASQAAKLSASFAYCRQIARRRARNFYFGMMLTPEPKRSAIYAVYAFMRTCDDLVDGDSRRLSVSMALEHKVTMFRRTLHRVAVASDGDSLPEGGIWPAVRHLVQTYGVRVEWLDTMLDGQLQDVQKHRYANFDELYEYCYRVASIVGLTCIAVWGYDGGEATRRLAEQRGVALQLTNVLRDVLEDAQRGRVYLPADELAEAGCDESQLREGRADEAFDRLMASQIARAREYYEKSASLERHIAPDCRAASWAIMQVYRELLERIAADPRAVLRRRVRVPTWHKLWIVIQAVLRRGGWGQMDDA